MRIALLSLFWLLICFAPSDSADADPRSIKNTYITFMNHLDVGFAVGRDLGYAVNVVNTYFDHYFPMAIQVARELKKDTSKGAPRLVYTTHPWLVDIYLDCQASKFPFLPEINITLHCPTSQQIQDFKQAVLDGDITWHAFPHNSEVELMDPSLFESGLRMSARLSDNLKGERANTMSQRDVPGMTRSVIPLLVKHGIKAISVGVNGGSAPPALGKISLWRDLNTNKDIYIFYHPGGYGGYQLKDAYTFAGFDNALITFFRGDNAGPPSVQEVKDVFKSVKGTFPNSVIIASSFNKFVDTLDPIRSQLPVVTSEIGDPWIYGVPSDPLKQASFRTFMRERTKCYESGECKEDDIRIQRFDRMLIKLPEHTGGLDVKTFLHDWKNYSNVQFESAKSGPRYQLMVNSWREQRLFLDSAIQCLENHPLASKINKALGQLTPNKPSLSGFTQISNMMAPLKIPGFELKFAADGSIIGLTDKSGLVFSSIHHKLFQMRYNTYDQKDYDNYIKTYLYLPLDTFFPFDFGKIGLGSSGANPVSTEWNPKLVKLWRKNLNVNQTNFVLEIQFPNTVHQFYGAPLTIYTELYFNCTDDELVIDSKIQWFDKTPTRLPEAMWVTFNPSTEPGGVKWRMDKMNLSVDPYDVVLNGSFHLHGIQKGVSLGLVSIESTDAPVVSPGVPTPFPIPLNQTSDISRNGMSFSLVNNIWGTNYVMWYPFESKDSSSLFRFKVRINRRFN